MCGRDVDPFDSVIDAVYRAWDEARRVTMRAYDEQMRPLTDEVDVTDADAWRWGDAADFLDTADEEPTVVVVEFPRAGVRIRTSSPEALADIVCIETGCGDPLMHRRHYIDA